MKSILILLPILLTIQFGFTALEPIARPTHNLVTINYIKVEEIDSKICNFSLTMKRVRGKVGDFNGTMLLFKPINYAKAIFSVFVRLSSNALQPTIISNLGIELCEVVKNNATVMLKTRFLSTLYPKMYDVLKDVIHPCPYLPGRYSIRHVVDQVNVPDIVGTHDYKIVLRVVDRYNNTMGQGFGMVSVRKGFPVDRKVKRKD